MNFEGNPNKMDVNRAYSIIEEIRGRAMVMGRNDTEPSDFDAITTKLRTGELSPEEAVGQAQSLIDNKQDYN